MPQPPSLQHLANSIVRKVKGCIKILEELKALELHNLHNKLNKVQSKTINLSKKFAVLKVGAVDNSLTDKQFKELRAYKCKGYWLLQRLHKLKQAISNFDNRGKLMYYGAKRLFKAQYHLKENECKNKNMYLCGWCRAHSNSLYFIGASGETKGNQNCYYDLR